jgi:hypothetical protein
LNVFHILVWHWGVVLLSSMAGASLGAAVEYVGGGTSVQSPKSADL